MVRINIIKKRWIFFIIWEINILKILIFKVIIFRMVIIRNSSFRMGMKKCKYLDIVDRVKLMYRFRKLVWGG